MRRTSASLFSAVARSHVWIKMFALLVLMLSAACGGTSRVPTDALWFKGEVTAVGDGQTTVSVQFSKGEFLHWGLFLETGDDLSVTAYGDTKRITNTGTTSNTEYVTTFPSDASGAYVIVLVRPSPKASAPNSTAVLPQPFQVTSPLGDQTLAPGGQLQLTWTPDSIKTDVVIVENCNTDSSGTPSFTRSISLRQSSTTGSFAIPVLQVLKNVPLAAGETCTGQLSLERSNIGTPDPAYKPGSLMVAKQIRSIGNLTIAP
jgi:hypothetical protein